MSTNKKYNIVILRRREVTTYPTLATPKIQVQVTYIGAGLPPTFIAIPKEDYTKVEEAKRIRKNIEERLKDKPERLTV